MSSTLVLRNSGTFFTLWHSLFEVGLRIHHSVSDWLSSAVCDSIPFLSDSTIDPF